LTKHKKEVEEVEKVKQETPAIEAVEEVIEIPKKVKVIYKTLESGPKGSIYPGQVVEVAEEEAAQLVDGGYAELSGS